MLSMVVVSTLAINGEPVDSLQLSIERVLKEQQLGEIVVNGNVPIYKLTHEGVRINVSGTALSQVGTADDVIRHIPGMYKVDNDKYNLFGNGEPVFYIDGRLVKDNTELSQLKSQDIAGITLITNPGAKYDASVSYAPNVGLWHPQFMVMLYKQWMTLQTTGGALRMNKPLCMFQSANTFKFSKSLSAELLLMLKSKGNDNNVEKDNVTLQANASITKTFLNDALSIRLAGSDLFHSQQRAVCRSEKIILTKQNNQDSRYVELTLRYTYNPAKSKYKGTGAGAAERQRI